METAVIVSDPWWATLIKAVLVALGLLGGFAYLTLIERQLLGRFQLRVGPTRVGPGGLLQPIADAVKAIFKEDLNVTMADKLVFILAPIISIGFALTAFGAIPAGRPGSLFGWNPWVFHLDAGMLVILAITSMGVYGVFLGGWSSGSKYPLLGGLRSSAQMISYELGMGMSLLGVLMLVGSTNLSHIVEWQGHHGFMFWYQALGFVLFFMSALAEVNRPPFDLPEAEQELVAGYLTEYTAIKWALYQMAEYVNQFTSSAMMATLFFKGWKGPAWIDGLWHAIAPNSAFLPSEIPLIWLIAKMAIFMFLFIWIKASILRMRYDQLMRFGWKYVMPLALINVMLTAGYLAIPALRGPVREGNWNYIVPNTTEAKLWPLMLINMVLLALLVLSSERTRTLWNRSHPRKLPGSVAGD